MAGVRTLHEVRLPLRRLSDLLRRPLETIEEAAGGHDVTRLAIGPRRLHIVNHPDLIRDVLEGEQVVFAPQRFDPTSARRLAGDSLPPLVGAAHAERRQIVEPIFAPQSIEQYAAVVAERVGARAAGWRDGAIVELETELTALAWRRSPRSPSGRTTTS
jgi:cytochrome P450